MYSLLFCLFQPTFVLVRGYGSQGYVWNRKKATRHTIHTSGYKAKPNIKLNGHKEQKTLRRAFSFDYSPDPRQVKTILNNLFTVLYLLWSKYFETILLFKNYKSWNYMHWTFFMIKKNKVQFLVFRWAQQL